MKQPERNKIYYVKQSERKKYILRETAGMKQNVPCETAGTENKLLRDTVKDRRFHDIQIYIGTGPSVLAESRHIFSTRKLKIVVFKQFSF